MSVQDSATPLVPGDMWDRLAPTWDRRGDWHAAQTAALTAAMVEQLAPASGERLVELACGPTADNALRIAAQLEDASGVEASDLSPAMLAAARRRADAADVHLGFSVQDVCALTYPDRSVDGLVARWVYMLLPSPAVGLREAARVLRPGGRLVFAVFAAAAANPFFMGPAATLIERGLMQPPRPDQPSMFALADPARTAELVTAAGFDAPSFTSVPLTYRLDDDEDLWHYVAEFCGPVSLTIAQLDPPARQPVRAQITDRLARFRTADGGYDLPGLAVVVRAETADVSSAD